jgi:hypothetical protein
MADKPVYCNTCKHADFAHKGQGHGGAEKGCDLCQKCKVFNDGK